IRPRGVSPRGRMVSQRCINSAKLAATETNSRTWTGTRTLEMPGISMKQAPTLQNARKAAKTMGSITARPEEPRWRKIVPHGLSSASRDCAQHLDLHAPRDLDMAQHRQRGEH